MTAFVELPLVGEQPRSVWVNPDLVGSVEAGSPTRPGTSWVTLVWGLRHNVALDQFEAVEALGDFGYAIDLRDQVLENLRR